MVRQLRLGTLARDLVELADVRRIDDAERLLRLLAAQSANLLSYRRVGARLDMHHDTVKAYVALLEQMFLVKRLPRGGRDGRPRVEHAEALRL